MLMKKIIFYFAFAVLIKSYCDAQVYKGQINVASLPDIGPSHYIPEYDFDFSTNPSLWEKVNPGMQVGYGSEDELYFRTEVPQISIATNVWNATGWKGERLNTQIVVW